MPIVLLGKCDGCRVCVDTCEQGAIYMKGEKALVKSDLCIGCGECVKVCPTGALVGIPKKVEA